MKVTNTAKCDIIFPDGTMVAKGQSGDVPDDAMAHPVVAGWLAEGMITVEEKPAARKPRSIEPKGE